MLSWGPHQSTMGKAQSRQVLTHVRRADGHVSTGPSAVFDQSSARMRRAISLVPLNGLCNIDGDECGLILQHSAVVHNPGQLDRWKS